MTTDVSRQSYPFSLPELPYPYDALEPHIDQKTLETHHRKHHQTYVTKLNEALEKETALHSKTLLELLRDPAKLPEAVRSAVKNNGGGHLNHDFFWNAMSPAKPGQGAREPGGALAAAIRTTFGSFDEFKKKFADASAKHFASGWVALSRDPNTRALEIVDLKDHETLVPRGHAGLLILDVWEHAYYLKYQNRRPEFIDAFWNVVNWSYAGQRFE
jgi:Fe-Mn family superoxide dismutase